MVDPESPTWTSSGPRSHQADEENIRLLSSFNDIFVSLAAILFVGAIIWFGDQFSRIAGAVSGAATCWLLAEYFTRERRMALPSILLMLGFVTAIVATTALVEARQWPRWAISDPSSRLLLFPVALLAGWAHWHRFRVPMTMAVIAVSALNGILAAVHIAWPFLQNRTDFLFLIGGIVTFACAMRWDSRDRDRTTYRSDVAFWLHLAAAPMIVHPLFRVIGLTRRASTVAVLDQSHMVLRSLLALDIYVVLGAVALIIDRRAGLVAGSSYAVVAIALLLRSTTAIKTDYALTSLLIGGVLLLLSVFWKRARALILRSMPDMVRNWVPPI